MGSCRFFTRSRNAPEWTAEETMALVGNVAAVEEDYGADFSSHQKWELVSSNTSSIVAAAASSSSSNYHRSASLCRRKWDDLLNQYTSIRDTCHGYDSWSLLDPKSKEDLGVPLSFDRHLYALIEDVLKASNTHRMKKNTKKRKQHRQHDSSSPSLSSDISHDLIYDLGARSLAEKEAKEEKEEKKEEREKEEEDHDVKLDLGMHRRGPKQVRQIKCEDEDTWKGVAETSSRLQKILGQIEALDRGELSEDVKGVKQFRWTKLDAETNLERRKKADQLIGMYAILLGNMRQLNELLERGIRT